jgi:hypothetical protein
MTNLARGQEGWGYFKLKVKNTILTVFQLMIYIANLLIMKTRAKGCMFYFP